MPTQPVRQNHSYCTLLQNIRALGSVPSDYRIVHFHGSRRIGRSASRSLLLLVACFPFLYCFLVLVTFCYITRLAEALKVIAVKESIVSADWIRNYVIHNLGANVPALLEAVRTKRVLLTEGLTQARPVVCVVKVR